MNTSAKNGVRNRNSDKKFRVDELLVRRGFAQNRTRAKAMLLSGSVLVEDHPFYKPGSLKPETVVIRLRSGAAKQTVYVSRAAEKLKEALNQFNLDVVDRVALDIGASTGGFTELLLEKGASKVYALDVGHNQLDWKLRSDERVRSIEGVNARYPEEYQDQILGGVDLVTIDVSFIGLEKIIPSVREVVAAHPRRSKTDWITLIKPQFEAGPELVGKGGVIRDSKTRKAVVDKVIKGIQRLGFKCHDLIESPIQGAQGNIEYLAHWTE